MFIIPHIFKPFSSILAVQTTRRGGVSSEPYHELNLGKSSGDSLEHVLENRRIVFDVLGIKSIAISHQTHSKNVLWIREAGNYTDYDAMITNTKDLFLAISSADCVPILLYDKKTESIASIHSGWRGTAQKILTETIEKMQETFHTNPKNIYAYIGTCISKKNYEVGREVADHFSDDVKTKKDNDKFLLDLKKANEIQLKTLGVSQEHIEISPYCSYENENLFFSYRRGKGKTGRMLAIIGIKSI